MSIRIVENGCCATLDAFDLAVLMMDLSAGQKVPQTFTDFSGQVSDLTMLREQRRALEIVSQTQRIEVS